MKFSRVHWEGEECLINLEWVMGVSKQEGCTILTFYNQEKVLVDESYEEICTAIGSAQGTLPLRGCKTNGAAGV